jgi:hypothetical protein
MPSDEEVTQRAGSLWAMTGFTQQALSTLLPPFEHALLAYLEGRTIAGHPRTRRRCRCWRTTAPLRGCGP